MFLSIFHHFPMLHHESARQLADANEILDSAQKGQEVQLKRQQLRWPLSA